MGLATLAGMSWAAPSRAQSAVNVEFVQAGQVDQGFPKLVLLPQVHANDLTVQLDCGGAWVSHGGSASAGDRIEIEIVVDAGVYQCEGTLQGEFVDGTTGEMPLSFQVQMYPSLEARVIKERFDLDNKRLVVEFDRPISTVKVEVFGLGGVQLGGGMLPVDGVPGGQPIVVDWEAEEGEVLKMAVTGTDDAGFWSRLDLIPWHYAIPHDDVVFASGAWDIQPEETGKLRDALAEVTKVVAKYGGDIPIHLYVSGYTDTVGPAASNQTLSRNRARSIGAWFRDQGFSGEIHYQGFGERVLAVGTPDETAEEANRRALYILAAEQPPISEAIPGGSWTAL